MATHRAALPVLLASLLALGTFHGATFQSESELEGASGALEVATHPLAGIALAGLLIRIVCGGRIHALHHRVWVGLGAFSYSIYLWHFPVIDRGLDALGFRSGAPEPAPFVLVGAIVLTALALGLAWLAHIAVERPAIRRRASGSAVAEPELRLQDAQEVTRPEDDQTGRSVSGSAHDRVTLVERAEVPAVH
jgi:peptidoglycan/LPS O-acetylase OafA/YrhL